MTQVSKLFFAGILILGLTGLAMAAVNSNTTVSPAKILKCQSTNISTEYNGSVNNVTVYVNISGIMVNGTPRAENNAYQMINPLTMANIPGNLTLYTETDPGGKYTVTSKNITVASQTSESSNVYTTAPTSITDFNLFFDMVVTTMDGDSGAAPFLLGDSTANIAWTTWGTSNGVGIWIDASSGTFEHAEIIKYVAGAQTRGTSITGVNKGTRYYYNFQRSGTYLNLSVYSDAARTIHVVGSPQSMSAAATAYNKVNFANNMITYAGARAWEINNISFQSAGTLWIYYYGNDPDMLWGNKTIAFKADTNTEINTTTARIFVYSDECTGTDIQSYRNTSFRGTFGNYTRPLFAGTQNMLEFAQQPFLTKIGSVIYVLIMFLICVVIYVKNQSVMQPIIIVFITAASLMGSNLIPDQYRIYALLLTAVATAAIFWRLGKSA